jgi:4-carboxymuconolactone decarboxylase
MTTRKNLRGAGVALRTRLFGPGAGEHFVPNYADLRAELAFGAVWDRPGLALPDRMIAALAALCSVQRLNHLRRHVGAALDLGLTPRSIVEVFIQCGIYAGLPASEDAMAVAEAIYAERGITLPPEQPRDDPIEELDRRGRAPRPRSARILSRRSRLFGLRLARQYRDPGALPGGDSVWLWRDLAPPGARPAPTGAGRGRLFYRAEA